MNPDDPTQFEAECIVLRAIDKLDRLGPDRVRALLGAGREDASGDFTEGAGLSVDQAETVMAFMSARGDNAGQTVANLRALVGPSATGSTGVDELDQIGTLLAAQGVGEDRRCLILLLSAGWATTLGLSLRQN